jgi:hypothetical protein
LQNFDLIANIIIFISQVVAFGPPRFESQLLIALEVALVIELNIQQVVPT